MNHTLWVLSTTPGSAVHLQRGWSAVCSLFYIVQSINACNVVSLLKHSKGFRKGHSWNIISSEEFVCMVRESSDCNWSEQKKSVLKSSVGIREGGRRRKSAEANTLKLGRMLCCMRRQREISTGGFASFAPSLSLEEVHTQQIRNVHMHTLLEYITTRPAWRSTPLRLICSSSQTLWLVLFPRQMTQTSSLWDVPACCTVLDLLLLLPLLTLAVN